MLKNLVNGLFFQNLKCLYTRFWIKLMNLKNYPNLEVEKILASEYGHSDVLDSLWSDLMHSTLQN